MRQQQKMNAAELYEHYFVPGIHARWTPLFLEHVQANPGERVLDVACGTGIVTRNLAPLVGAEGEVVGLDANPKMLAVARAQPEPAGAAIDWQQGDAASLPSPDHAFDLVTCQQGLQFFSDRDTAVREMQRVLAPDGRGVLSVWQSLERHPLYAALIESEARFLDVSVEEVSTPFAMGDAKELRTLLSDAGFQHTEIASATRTVQFPEPQRFVMLTLLAAASIIPASEMDTNARADMVETVSQEVDPTVQRYVEGDVVSFPMHAHIAVAYA